MKSVEVEFQKISDTTLDKARLHGFRALTEKEKVVFCIHTFESEVANGGFHQYFKSEYGAFALETAAVLKRIGALKALRLLREALKIFPDSSPPREPFARQRELFKVGAYRLERLSELDHQFYEYEDDLAALTLAYILSSP